MGLNTKNTQNLKNGDIMKKKKKKKKN